MLDGIKKEAIRLSHLRQATKYVPFHRIPKAKWMRVPGSVRDILPPFLTISNAPVQRINLLPRIFGLKRGINVRGDAYKSLKNIMSLPDITTPQGREAFNRIVLLHEGKELRELSKLKGLRKFFGFIKNKPRFASHASTAPMVQDLNLAATLEGKGMGEVRSAFKALRAEEIDSLRRNIPASQSILKNLGVKRVSRADADRLQNLLEGFKESYSKSLGWKKHIPLYKKLHLATSDPIYGLGDLQHLRV